METRKLSLIEDLPTQLKKTIYDLLDAKDSINSAKSCKALQTTSRPNFSATLLQHVARGEQISAEEFILEVSDPALILQKGKVTDYSHRTFNNISPLQYVAWAYDIHMLKMLLAYIPKEKQKEASHQLQELDEKGTEHGFHYDFSKLINLMENYAHHQHEWDDTQRIEHLRKIGAEQKNVPTHVSNEYCHPDRHFVASFVDSHNLFRENVLKRTLTLDYYLPTGYVISNHWYTSDYTPSSFLILRYNHGTAMGISEKYIITRLQHNLEAILVDSVAIKNLFVARTKQYLKLKETILVSSFKLVPSEFQDPAENNSSSAKTTENNDMVSNCNDPNKSTQESQEISFDHKQDNKNESDSNSESDSDFEESLDDKRTNYRKNITLFKEVSATEASPLIEKKELETFKTCISCNLI